MALKWPLATDRDGRPSRCAFGAKRTWLDLLLAQLLSNGCPMRRWFLSYHSPDQALAERLKAAIERKDAATRVFFAPTHLRAGGSWSAQLAQEIARGEWLHPADWRIWDRQMASARIL